MNCPVSFSSTSSLKLHRKEHHSLFLSTILKLLPTHNHTRSASPHRKVSPVCSVNAIFDGYEKANNYQHYLYLHTN